MWNLKAEYYLDLMSNDEPFSLSRFGDGEILCMYPNGMKENCDGNKFFPELSAPMKQIFKNNYPYYHCLLDCTFDYNADLFRALIAENCPDMEFYNGEIWQELSLNGRIEELVSHLDKHNPVLVGGKHIGNAKDIIGWTKAPYHLRIPDVDSFNSIQEIMQQIGELYIQGYRMFCFSAGYTTKIIIDTLFPYIGHDTFMIDMGSVFDPYCGRLSRDTMELRGFEYFQPFTKMKLK